MAATNTHKRYRFFREQGSTASSALDLARAEALLDSAREHGCAAAQWLWDDQPWDEGTEISAEEASAKFASNEWTGPFGCVLWVADRADSLDEDALNDSGTDPSYWSSNTSLWGIVLGPRGTNDPYARVIVAELASEMEDDLRQAIGDAADARKEIAV